MNKNLPANQPRPASRLRSALLAGTVSVLDVLLGLLVLGYNLESGFLGEQDLHVGLSPVLALFGGPVLLLGRRRPKLTVFATLVLSVFSLSGVAFLVALFRLAKRRLDLWIPLVIAVDLALETLFGIEPMSAGIALVLVLALGAVALAGAYRGQRLRTLAGLRERAERAEAERAAQAEHSRFAERHRIAREMHDTLAHRMSLVAVQAGALQVDAPDAETADAARLIRRTAHEALGELRQVLGVLRNGTQDAALSPQSGLENIESLVADWHSAGTAVVLRRDGTGPVPGAVSRAAFRIVQEAITNAARHAPGAPILVEVTVGGGAVAVEVSNGTAPAPQDGPGAGLGLLGLDERVRLLGGQFSHGPTADGGFRVRARLPLPAAPDNAPDNTGREPGA